MTALAHGSWACPALGAPNTRAARRFDILMSEGEESDDPNELPTRYALGTFEVETILKYRCNRMKQRDEWLVKWKNYPTS
ncbi:hypothetical protein T492DRAFT_857527 [Pavlovales sp. CCMP2436]|nr:hypothetical protein T492DRAFT_857527 [Pavlovales sp. CCMP2436]